MGDFYYKQKIKAKKEELHILVDIRSLASDLHKTQEKLIDHLEN